MPGIIILIAVAVVVLISGIKIVPQAQVFVIERLGTYKASLGTGPHYIIPFFDKKSFHKGTGR